MNNLGPYQAFSIAAKSAGGVPQLIENIERGAVSKALPGIVAKSVGAGAALMGIGLVAGKMFLDQRKVDQVAAEEAKKRLLSEFSDDGLQSGEPTTPPATA